MPVRGFLCEEGKQPTLPASSNCQETNATYVKIMVGKTSRLGGRVVLELWFGGALGAKLGHQLLDRHRIPRVPGRLEPNVGPGRDVVLHAAVAVWVRVSPAPVAQTKLGDAHCVRQPRDGFVGADEDLPCGEHHDCSTLLKGPSCNQLVHGCCSSVNELVVHFWQQWRHTSRDGRRLFAMSTLQPLVQNHFVLAVVLVMLIHKLLDPDQGSHTGPSMRPNGLVADLELPTHSVTDLKLGCLNLALGVELRRHVVGPLDKASNLPFVRLPFLVDEVANVFQSCGNHVLRIAACLVVERHDVPLVRKLTGVLAGYEQAKNACNATLVWNMLQEARQCSAGASLQYTKQTRPSATERLPSATAQVERAT
jgi:hypothetical protein